MPTVQDELEARHVLGGESETRLAWVREVEQGLPVAALDRLSEFGGLAERDLDAIIPRRTRDHQRSRDRLTPEQSDRLARAARVYAHAHRTFADADRANRWMRRPHPALGGERPLDLLGTGAGADLVTDLLGRIEHGVFG